MKYVADITGNYSTAQDLAGQEIDSGRDNVATFKITPTQPVYTGDLQGKATFTTPNSRQSLNTLNQ